MSTFDSTKSRLEDLLKSTMLGAIQLPDFQRGCPTARFTKRSSPWRTAEVESI